MEFLDIVNEQNEVVGKASHDEIYEKKLPHRIVHVLIFDKDGKLALQLRSKQKSFCPQHWSTPVGGHVQSGETYEEAAKRESIEELGIKPDVAFLYSDLYEDEGLKKFLSTFELVYDGPFNINPAEVEKVEFFTLEEIQIMIKNGEKFHPELLFLLKKHFGIK